MNYGLARIIKEPLYQALRNTMYIIIGAFALTIYSMFVVNDKEHIPLWQLECCFPSGLYILVDMS